MAQTDIEQVELSISEAKKSIEMGKMAEKLAINRDFKKVVMDGYFVDEAARLVHLLGDPRLNQEGRESVLRDIQGLGAFKQYLQNKVREGHMAQDALEEHQETLDELRDEDGEE